MCPHVRAKRRGDPAQNLLAGLLQPRPLDDLEQQEAQTVAAHQAGGAGGL